jgi:glycosyl transferase, family 25
MGRQHMRVSVISLELSTGRRDTMRAQLQSLGVPYEFIRATDGIRGEHLGITNYSDSYCLQAWRRPLTPGEVGCFASHYRLWQRCVEKNEPMIVMEDDVELGKRFADAVAIAAEMAGRIGFLRLAGINVPVHRKLPVNGIAEHWELVRFLRGPLGTQCYAIAPHAAARFIQCSEKWTLPVDNYIDRFWEHGVESIGLLPFPVSVRVDVASEIWQAGGSRSALIRNRVPRPKRVARRAFEALRRSSWNLKFFLMGPGANQERRP